jgi:hypothetical protein
MTPIRLLTDEDVCGSIAAKLRTRGIDAVSTPEVRRLGETDASQLVWAARGNRVLLTFNVAHFARLHGEWMRLSRHHRGIVVSSHRPIGDVLRRVMALVAAVDAEEMRDRLEYLSNW